MVFGKIDYINLLPLHIHLKKYPLPNGLKKAMEYKKGIPSKLNEELFYRRIDAAIISSVESARAKYKNLDLGICANKRVWSVILEKNVKNAQDPSSATSNILAHLLGQNGKVIIGDEALRLYVQDKSRFTDLCSLWYEKTQLPFVFARFSCVRKKNFYAKILKNFTRVKIKIPCYILERYSKTRKISPRDIRDYLEIIYYKMGHKEHRALKTFLKMAQNKS